MKTLSMGELPDQPNAATVDTDIEVELPTDDDLNDADLVENPDGSVDVVLDGDSDKVESEDFMENLAELIPETELSKLGTQYRELIDQDVEAREDRDKQYAEGIKRTGLGNEAPGGASFEGASKVVHPMLAKGSVDFASRAIKELFPANGPCKTKIIGEQTEAKLDKAERKRNYMNWQSTKQVEENRAELEKLLSQVPLGGAQYKRWWWDPELKRPRTEAVFIDDVFTPYGQSDFYTAPRVSYRQRVTEDEFNRRVRTGLYRDIDVIATGLYADTKSKEATNKVEGVSDSSAVYDKDGIRTIWQVEANIECLDDPLCPEDRAVPYILHLDDGGKVLGLFRNWAEKDDRYRKKHWTSEWPFIPWRGGPAVGLSHIIGSMSGAATGALRAILDAAHISNFPGAVKLKGGRTAGQSTQIDATQVQEIDAPAGVDDIRKLIMPLPFNGPSTVLLQVLEWLTQQAESVVATASDKIADAGNDMPVGTALALIEHGSTNFSAVHARLHNAMARDLEILHRLDAEHIEDEETVEELGELVVYRKDFEGPMDIIPVSDPNIFSETQRYAQLQAIMQLRSDPAFAGFFKNDALLSRALKLLQIPDIEGITNLPKEAKRLSPIEENYVVSMAERPLKVYEEQDDLAHLKAHIQYATAPMFGANPLIAPVAIPGLLQHCKEHLLAYYRKHVHAAMDSLKENFPDIPDEEIQSQALALMDQQTANELSKMVMPGLEKMQQAATQIAQASAPKPDPGIQLAEDNKVKIAQAEIASREKVDMEKIKAGNEKVQVEAALEKIAAESTERMGALASSVELIKDQQNNAAANLLAQFQATSNRTDMMLQAVLDGIKAGATETTTDADGNPVTTTKPAFDTTALMGPILQTVQAAVGSTIESVLQQQMTNFQAILLKERETNEAAMARLGESLAATQQPRPAV